MIRLLLDQGIPRSVRSLLASASWDVVHVGDIGLGRAADTSILERAKQDNRVVVTLDAERDC